ncbi:MAG: NAD(+)/NADH kinase [Gemmatimonadota bacterium]
MRLGVLGTPAYPALGEVLSRVERVAAPLGLELAYARELQSLLPGEPPVLPERLDGIDCLLTLGGDGTLLRGARLAGPCGIPVLGCNLGQLGFMTAAPLDRLEEALRRLVEGDYTEDIRLTLDVQVLRAPVRSGAATDSGDQSESEASYFALNDAVVHKSGFARLMTMRVWVDEEEVGQYSADGIVISTATGSTAYSLSAGGPILVPTLDALVATPICPHTLAVRPVVVSADSSITVEVVTRSDWIVLTVDGQVGSPLAAGDRVRTARSPHPIRLLRLPGHSFFSVLRQKLRWGDVRPIEM